jgi:membrane AbrB-like protein
MKVRDIGRHGRRGPSRRDRADQQFKTNGSHMAGSMPERAAGPLARLAPAAQWALLLAGSAAISLALEWLAVPAALLLGPMVAGIALRINGGAIRVARPLYYAAQAVLGCLIARAITPTIVVAFLKDGPLFLAAIAAVIAASSLIGWAMSRWGVLPGSTAIWGTSPGAATAMMIMAEAYGADAQTVALMQYLRVVFVASAASILARFWLGGSGGVHPVVWLAPLHWRALAETLALAAVGGVAGRWLRLPAGALLTPLVAGALLHGFGLIDIELPQPLLAVAYAMIGWSIGLGFTRSILAHAWRALPQIILSILVLIGFCWLLALLLTALVGADPLTAYLATSPGGIDTVAIIASSSNVDVSFVMAMQTTRLAILLMVGPSLARALAGRVGKRAG